MNKEIRKQCVCLTNFIWRSTPIPKCHVTFSKTKMSVNWHIHLILICHPNFGLHNILGKLIIWIIKLQSSFVSKNKIKIKTLLLIERNYPLVSHVSPKVDNSPIHSIHFKPTKRDPHKSLKGLQVQPIVQIAFDCILFGNSSLTNSYIW